MRLVVVSNRLPVTVTEKEGKFRLQESVGGLATGLKTYFDSLEEKGSKKAEYIWVGWPGGVISEDRRKGLRARLAAEFRAYPVFLSARETEKFYHGFCNKTIWPLFHYFPSYTGFEEEFWRYYQKVNQEFAQVVAEILRPGDVIWIHDYQLMLLPSLLREQAPQVPIGFFLHIPFPSYEIYRLLPAKWRSEILRGLLGADLVGFHTADYTQYFLGCVLRVLGYEHSLGQIITGERAVRAETFPMGIDFARFHRALEDPEVERENKRLQKTLGQRKVVLSIDRLDYTKGIIKRLEGFEQFLEKNPKWHGKVILVLGVVPSRTGVEAYQEMKREIDELVGRINGRFGRIDWTPALYRYRSLPFASLAALYSTSDVALVTPLRDGMNLIAKEYIASRKNQSGVLILSEAAGAAKELGEALIINPNHREEIAEALQAALEMPPAEQVRRNQIMQERLRRFDINWWADSFIQQLLATKEDQKRFQSRLLNSQEQEKLLADFQNAKRRLLLLDYDGTLIPFSPDPQNAKPSPELLALLHRLTRDPKNKVVVISGRDKAILDEWFAGLEVGLVAEHGVWRKEKGGKWSTTKPVANDWKPTLLPILQMYVERLPGSFVEEKDFSLAWHYRRADAEQGSLRARELIDELVHLTANIDVQVLRGNKVVEVRPAGADKGTAAQRWLAEQGYDFVLAIGDDRTDEDLFQVLPESAYSIRVGMTPSRARFNLREPAEVLDLLGRMVEGKG